MNATLKLIAFVFLGAVQPVVAQGPERLGRASDSANPILPGFFADPSVVQVDGMLYIFPWAANRWGQGF